MKGRRNLLTRRHIQQVHGEISKTITVKTGTMEPTKPMQKGTIGFVKADAGRGVVVDIVFVLLFPADQMPETMVNETTIAIHSKILIRA